MPAPTVPTGPGDMAALLDHVQANDAAELLQLQPPGADDPNLRIPALVLPEGKTVTSVRQLLDEYRAKPERRTGTATLADLASFIEHVKRFSSEDSVIFGNRAERAPSVTAVYDYNPEGADLTAARFLQHRAHYAFPVSEPWQAWAKAEASEPMLQGKFAAFLEERIMDILPAPSDGRADAGALALDLVATLGGQLGGPSDLLNVSRRLKMSETAEVTNAQNLASGEMEIVYRTEHRDAQGQPLRVPTLFLVGMPVFDGGDPYRLPIRLQYRRVEGKVFWIIRRYRPELVFFDAYDRALKQVREETARLVLLGAPESLQARG